MTGLNTSFFIIFFSIEIFSNDTTVVDTSYRIESNNAIYDTTDFVTGDIAPECINYNEVVKSIVYPEDARYDHVEGRVVLKALIGFNGDVIEVKVVSGKKVFHKEVKKAGMKLKFTRAIHNGEPVKCWVTVPFMFKLKDDDE